LVEGLVAGTTIALPYIVPFYLALSILEDSGYLARIAYLMDFAMHRIGLHGKGFIPLMLGFGCSVPAILSSRIMETERERLICAFAASLIPCAAVAFKALPGEPVGLIMEMPSYRMPTAKVTASRTWFKLEHFVKEAFPIMVAGNMVLVLARMAGLLGSIQWLLRPITVGWLGLPAAVGVTLIFGVLRKELTLILLASMMGTANFAQILTPVQMFVFAFVVMVYVPCIATIGVLAKEFGLHRDHRGPGEGVRVQEGCGHEPRRDSHGDRPRWYLIQGPNCSGSPVRNKKGVGTVSDDYHGERRSDLVDASYLPADRVLQLLHGLSLYASDYVVDAIHQVGLLDLGDWLQALQHLALCADLYADQNVRRSQDISPSIYEKGNMILNVSQSASGMFNGEALSPRPPVLSLMSVTIL
jgi:hypothetical protein